MIKKNINEEKLIDPEFLLFLYSQGFFPMADENDGEIYLYNPDPRAVFPLNSKLIPRKFRNSLKKHDFQFTIDQCFSDVILNCAKRDSTWISKKIVDSYINLHNFGGAHSVETWENGQLVGGLYGVSVGAAFFGESMFSLVPDASKAALFFLKSYIIDRDFILLDSQFINDHTKLLGAVEIPRSQYLAILKIAIDSDVKFID